MEFFKKNKYGVVFLTIVFISIVHYTLFFDKCKRQATDKDILVSMLICSSKLDQEIHQGIFRNEMCQKLNRPDNCEFVFDDSLFLQQEIKTYVNKCVRKDLTDSGFCTDKKDFYDLL